MKIYILVVALLVTNVHAMDNIHIQWNQNRLDAVTLLQGTGTSGFLKLEEIEKLESCIKIARSHMQQIERLHNSPPLLLLPASLNFAQLYRINSFVAKYRGINDGKNDSHETQYHFEPTADVAWIADEVSKNFNIETQVKPLFTPKIKLEYGGAGSDVFDLIFTPHDEQKEYIFTFKSEKLIGSGIKSLKTIT